MAQVNKISSFKSFTEVKNQEASMKLREENNAKRQETVGKIGAILDEMGLTSLSELDEDKKQALIKKMFGSVSEDEAEDIEDELIKLGKPKKLEERNAFLGARAKAIEEDKNEFEFNGKTYKVTVNEGNAFGDAVRKAKEAGEKEFEFDGKTYKVEEGNAFGDAVRKAKEAGEKEFEFDGETYKVEEAKRTKFTGKTAHDLYTQIGGKPVEVFVKNDWYSVNPSELKDDKGNYFTGYTKDGSDYEFELKEIDFIQESVITEGTFYRMPKDIISDELYLTSRNLTNFYDRTAAGNDVDPGVIDTIIRGLNRVKKSVKKFNSKEEVTGTVYESAVNEANIALIKYVEDASNKTFKNGGNGQNLLDSAYELASHIETYAKGRDNNGPGEDGFYGPTVTSLFKRLVDAMSADDIKYNNQSAYESLVNEGDMTKFYDGFIVLNSKNQEMYKFKYIKGISNVKVEVDAINKLVKSTGLNQANFAVHGFVKKGEWNSTDAEVLESVVNEAASTAGELASFISQNAKHFASFLKPKTLSAIANGNIVEIKPGSKSFTITVDFDKKTIDTTGKPAWPESTSYIEIMEYVKTTKFKLNESEVTESGFQRSGPSAEATRKAEQLKKLKKLKDREESIDRLKKLQLKKHKAANESEVNEAEVSSDEEFKEYAMTVLKKAFGDEFDEAKAEEVVDGILKKCDGDYGAAVGMLTSSLGESVVTEREETQIGTHRYQGKSYPLYTDDEHNHYIKVNGRIIEVDESFVTEAFDANYWEDYHEKSTKITSLSKVARAVEDGVEDWNDNNEEGPSNEVTPAGEKKVMNLAHDFFKAKGYISADVIDAMIAQES